MKLREAILSEHSKANCARIVKWVGNNQERFDQLIDLLLNDKNHVVVQRAAWPLSYAVIANARLVRPHFSKLLNNLQKPYLPNAVKRNSLRLMQDISIPAKYHGDVMTLCFDYILS